MKAYTEQNPVFSESIQITEPTDAAHADNINAAPEQLLENTLVLKEKVEQAEQMINDKATEIAKNNDELERRVEQTLNEKSEQIDHKIKHEAEQRFKDLYGLANKTVTLSAGRSTVTSVSGDIKVTTTISKDDRNTTLTTVVEKGEQEQEGYEKYTKTTTMTKLSDGRTQVTVNYIKNV